MIRRSNKPSLGLTLLACLSIAMAFGCSKSEDEEEDGTTSGVPSVGGLGQSSTPDENSAIPDVGSISLTNLGAASGSSLVQEEDTCSQDDLGVFGLALGGACATAPFVSHLLLGANDGDFNGDGTTNCTDWEAAQADPTSENGPGILVALMCVDLFRTTDEIQHVSFIESDEDDPGARAISFRDWDNDVDAVGHWTKGNAASYPADIRIWGGQTATTFEEMDGIFAISLASLNAGEIQIAWQDVDTEGNVEAVNGKVDFSKVLDTTNCATEPNATNCHYQDIQLHNELEGHGFHLKIHADAPEDATFYAIEGMYTYNVAAATAHFGDHADTALAAELTQVRSIYFQTIQKDGQIWGRFAFRDEAGDMLSYSMDFGGGPVDVFAELSDTAGICQDLGTDSWVTCTDITYTDYDALWDPAAMPGISASPVDADFTTDKPTSAEICMLSAGCISLAN